MRVAWLVPNACAASVSVGNRDAAFARSSRSRPPWAATAVRKIGGTTLRSIGDISRRQTLTDNDRDFVPAAEMLAELREDNLKLVESFRAVKEAAEEAKDNATSGIVDEWTDQAEERAWFLFEASRKA